MTTRHLLMALLIGGLAAPLQATAQIVNYWGGSGTIRAGTTTSASTSTSRGQSSSTSQTYDGSTYTTSGSNITPDGPVGPGQTYQVTRPGEPYQFSETFRPAGLVQIESGSITTETTTITNSLSVFSEID